MVDTETGASVSLRQLQLWLTLIKKFYSLPSADGSLTNQPYEHQLHNKSVS